MLTALRTKGIKLKVLTTKVAREIKLKEYNANMTWGIKLKVPTVPLERQSS